MTDSIDPSAPILIFDSGVGGLTVLAALREIMPEAPVIFAADQAGLPYGTKSESEIAARVAGLLGRMSERYRPRLACIACNTASTIALSMVRDVLEIPIVGTVPAIKPAAARSKSGTIGLLGTVPAIKPAAARSKTGTIGLLGTEATVRQVYVDRLEAEFASGKRLLRQAAPGLVNAAEAKLRGQDIDPEAVRNAVAALRAQEGGDAIDTVVLACTHFPLLNTELQAEFGDEVDLIDGSRGIARRIAHLIEGQPVARGTLSRAVTTGDIDAFRQLSPIFATYGIDRLDRF